MIACWAATTIAPPPSMRKHSDPATACALADDTLGDAAAQALRLWRDDVEARRRWIRRGRAAGIELLAAARAMSPPPPPQLLAKVLVSVSSGRLNKLRVGSSPGLSSLSNSFPTMHSGGERIAALPQPSA